MKLVVSDWSDPLAIRTVEDSEAALYEKAFVFRVECEADIRAVITERVRFKKQYDDSMKLVYELVNKFTREGRR